MNSPKELIASNESVYDAHGKYICSVSMTDRAKELLDTMMDVMENIQNCDDAAYGLRMKILNNIDYLIDALMEEYEEKKTCA